MTTRSNAYWDRRALQRMASYQKDADKVMATISKAYDKGVSDIETEIQKIFRRFTEDGNLTDAAARRILNESISRAEWLAIKDKIKEVKDPKLRRRMLNRLNAPAYRARISRLEALKADVYVQSKIIADVEIAQSTLSYTSAINQAYTQTIFDVQKGLGVAFEFAAMPNRTVETILRNPWSGSHFSTRVWGNTDELARQLNETITAGFKSGISSRKMVRELQERMNVGKHVANRLIRTETTYMTNAAELESYKELGIEKYIFLATLDKRTSDICQDMDLKEFFVKDAKAGKNYPPMHVFCRSTTRAKIDVGVRRGIMRRARNPRTGKNELIPAGMNYKQWYEKYVKG